MLTNDIKENYGFELEAQINGQELIDYRAFENRLLYTTYEGVKNQIDYLKKIRGDSQLVVEVYLISFNKATDGTFNMKDFSRDYLLYTFTIGEPPAEDIKEEKVNEEIDNDSES